MVIKVPGAKQSKSTLLTEATHYSKAIRQELDEIAAKREFFMENLFSVDWQRANARPTGTIESLVALSVGLVPDLANTDFIDEAKRFFYARNDSVSISKLNTFLRRLADARENIAPLGELHPIEGKETRFKKSEFLAFAGRLGWELPEEFKLFYTPNNDDGSGDSEEDNDQNDKGPRELQIEAIIAKAKEFEYDLLSIPIGGKAKIKKACYPVVTESAFDRAWIKAGERGLIAIKDKNKFLPKQ